MLLKPELDTRGVRAPAHHGHRRSVGAHLASHSVRSLHACHQRRPGTCSTPGSIIANGQRAIISRFATRSSASSSPSSSSSSSGMLAGLGLEDTGASDLQSLVAQIPAKKLAIWGAVGAVAYSLSHFIGISMGTFIISFVGNSFVEATENSPLLSEMKPTVRRRAMVVLYFSIIAAIIALFGLLTIPDIAREGVDFVNRLQSDNIWVVIVEKMRKGLGSNIMECLEKIIYLAASSDISVAASSSQVAWTPERSVKLGMAVSGMLKGYTTTAAKITGGLIKFVTQFALQVVVSLILSFMLVWDMPSIAAGVSTLKNSRLSAIYNEVAPSLTVFGKLFGKALECQALIAVVNTGLTALGMWLLKIPGMGLLSLFVFLCCFIPIAGCAISTVPIGFVALTEYGFLKLALVIVMVVLVHFIEAYALNPVIYSHHLKLHPLIVLSVLVVAEHSMGTEHKSTVREVGEKELEKVLNRTVDED